MIPWLHIQIFSVIDRFGSLPFIKKTIDLINPFFVFISKIATNASNETSKSSDIEISQIKGVEN
jgi:hypothetical protein